MLWRICYSLEELQRMTAELLASGLGAHAEISRSLLGMTRHSRYMIAFEKHKQVDMGAIRPGEHKFLFLHPMAKTSQWYMLDPDQRQKIINEQIEVLGDFPRVKMNVIYGYGMDDWDFYIAYESDFPEDVLELGVSMRETESYRYNQPALPVFTCVRTTPEEMLAALG